MSRHFITKAQIDELAERGETRLEVDDRTTVTDLARERARERGIAVVRVGDRTAVARPDVPPATDGDLRTAIRSAVLGALGEAPAGLDEAIDKVLGGR